MKCIILFFHDFQDGTKKGVSGRFDGERERERKRERKEREREREFCVCQQSIDVRGFFVEVR